MNTADLPDRPIAELAPLIRRRELSPVELTAAVLARIERLNPLLHTFITVLPEQAMAAAQRAEDEIAAGRYRGPLHGIPIAHKDVFLTRGVRTTGHSRVLHEHVPDTDATVVARLREAGALLLGKLNTYEFACGATELFGVPVNPWDTRRITAGSSAGSASGVSAGLCMAATGTDTGGSIRSPASFCGVVGLKPTYGLVSRAGVLPLSWSLDHVGPLGRSVRDVAILLAAMAGYDAADAGSSRTAVPDYLASLGGLEATSPPDIRGRRFGVPKDVFGVALHPQVRERVDAALAVFEALGAELVPLDLPAAAYTAAAQKGVMLPEATTVHLPWLRTRPRDYAAATRRKLLLGACVSGTEYLQAQRLRQQIRTAFAAALRDVDAMVWPTSARPASRVDEPQVPVGVQTRLTNLTGTPSLSIPCGFTDDGLPVAVQINGRAFDEATVLQLAEAFERATAFHRYHPPVHASEPLTKAAQFTFAEPPTDLAAGQRGQLERDIGRSLERLGLTLFPEDRDSLIGDLWILREGLRGADDAALEAVEPSVHQAPLGAPPLPAGLGAALSERPSTPPAAAQGSDR